MARRDPYAAFETLVAPGRERAELWRLLLGLCVVALVGFGLSRALFGIARMAMEPERFAGFAESLERAATPGGVLVLLFLGGAMGIGAMVAADLLHHRRALGLFGPPGPARRQFGRVFTYTLGLYLGISLLLPMPEGHALGPGLPLQTWLTLLPLTLLALLVQTGGEEVLFRGYIQSQIAARVASPLLWMGLPSVLFALGHYAPDYYGSNAWIVVAWAFAFGIITADLTARAGTLGPAIALHMVNNLFAIAITALDGPFSGLALYTLPYGPENEAAIRALLPLDLAMLGLGWLTARIAIRA